MEKDNVIILNEHDDIITPLTQGKNVQCLECKKGIYRPLHASAKKTHYFTCDYCGAHVHFDPMIEI